jgi:hypothetical protein
MELERISRDDPARLLTAAEVARLLSVPTS